MQDLISLPAIIFLTLLVFIPQVLNSLPTPPPPPEKSIVLTIASPTPTNIPLVTITKVPTPTPDSSPWGIAKQVSDHTWVIKVQNDPAMGSPSEILNALNDLRARQGAQPLKTDSRLCDYAQKRADYFKSIQNTDEHKGLIEFLKDENNYAVLGYNWIGENSSYGYVMSGVHLIEFVYNSDPDHSKNQLDPKWDHGCVGVNSPATNLIFATSPR
jgi:uncharacterized protein YkwD